MKSQLDNPDSDLYIYQTDGTTAVTSGNVGTGMVVKLVISGTVEDQKVIIVLGDVNGDGVIDVFDIVRIVNHFLGDVILSGAPLIAADVNKDTNADVFDIVRIVNHFLGDSPIHN